MLPLKLSLHLLFQVSPKRITELMFCINKASLKHAHTHSHKCNNTRTHTRTHVLTLTHARTHTRRSKYKWISNFVFSRDRFARVVAEFVFQRLLSHIFSSMKTKQNLFNRFIKTQKGEG